MTHLRGGPALSPAPVGGGDGRHDFDFLVGHWRVANRKLQSPLAEESQDWVRFDADVETESILGGLGNIDRYSAPKFPGRPGYQALAVRLFDPDSRVWRIWWASTVGGGELDTPVIGRFAEGRGLFECDDLIDGRMLKVRFEWLEINTGSPRWEQSFSVDGGLTWRRNWIMQWHRDAPAHADRAEARRE
jgi:hypothetical protein